MLSSRQLLRACAPLAALARARACAAVPTSMKAVRVHEFGAPEVMKVEQTPMPELKDGEVLVRVGAFGVNPVETYVRAGAYAVLPPLPFTPGSDGAGEVVEVKGGGEVSTKLGKIGVGSRVYFSGTRTGAYASYTAVQGQDVFPLPDSVSFEQGAALGVPYKTAWRALHMKMKVSPGKSLLVHGASGAVGLAAVQLGKASGLLVIGTASGERGMQAIRDAGADYVLNHREEGYLNKLDEIALLPPRPPAGKNRAVDYILENLANVNLDNDMQRLAKDGVIAVVGNRGSLEVNPRNLMQCEGTLVGVLGGLFTPEQKAEAHAGLHGLLHTGVLKPVIGKAYAMEAVGESHVDVIEQKGGAAGKLVVSLPSSSL
mmetsp:Transcript_11385/g.25071  ORF Transcript_11385/g.25071 Transcript_11385/m.25071 type:complete len:372 (+) Transcript_11385:27-1142(+)